MSLPRAAAFLLLASFIALALGDVWSTSPTHDETTHLAAGWTYLRTADFRLNREHPPLIKMIAAAPLVAMNIWPARRGGDAPHALDAMRISWQDAARDDRAQWRFAQRWLYAVRDDVIDRIPSSQPIPRTAFLNDSTAMFRASRTTLVLVLAPLLFAVVALWSAHLWGPWGAVLPLALLAFDPNFIAHIGLVTTDAGLALFMCASVYFFWRCSRDFSRFNIAAFALATALAHVTKFSAVILWPALLLAAGLAARENLRRLLTVLAIALATTAAVIVICYAGKPAGYVAGFEKALLDALGREAYLRGVFDTSGSGFRSYFLWTLLLKTPVVTLIMFAAAIWFCVRSRRKDLVFLLVPPLVYFIVASGGSLNIGHRHILPVYPLLFIACGVLSRRWLIAAPIAAIVACLAWGNHLAYFNELAGGARGGSRYLIDSNLDWGQDLQRLGRWVEEHKIREPIGLAYFGTADPRYYGIAFVGPRSSVLGPRSIVAISVNELVRGTDGDRDAYRKLLRARNARLVGRAGMTIDIYE